MRIYPRLRMRTIRRESPGAGTTQPRQPGALALVPVPWAAALECSLTRSESPVGARRTGQYLVFYLQRYLDLAVTMEATNLRNIRLQWE